MTASRGKGRNWTRHEFKRRDKDKTDFHHTDVKEQ